MSNIKSFTREFIQNKKMIGSIMPSWIFLVNKIIKKIDFSKDKVLVEFGPGTGAFTFKIIKKLKPDSKLLVFELNEAFYNSLKEKIKDSRVILINDSAENIEFHLKENNLDAANVIISSLPLTNLPARVRLNIVNSSKKMLSQNGRYIQYQYSSTAKELLEKKYRKVDISYTIINMPPAIIYTCYK